MTEQQFKKLNRWFQKLNQKMNQNQKEISEKLDLALSKLEDQVSDLSSQKH